MAARTFKGEWCKTDIRKKTLSYINFWMLKEDSLYACPMKGAKLKHR